MAPRTRVGVIGCGLIAQVMHLPYLAELDDRFELAALCDVSEPVLSACRRRFHVRHGFQSWQELVAQPLDAVLVLTSGNHAPMAVAAAQAGKHVFVEKPMALSAEEGVRMVTAARRAGVRLMVGTMKRYDPAYERLVELLPDLGDVRLVRVTTLESPFEPYVEHYPLVRPVVPAPGGAAFGDEDRIVDRAVGANADEATRWCYRFVLLDNLVHEFNMLRGALGEPTAVTFAGLDPASAAVHMRFGASECHLSWVDLPGIANYRQEIAFYAPAGRLTLTFPSPFLRSAPSRLTVEGGDVGTPHAWQRDEVIAYDEAFRRELIHFHESIVDERPARTEGVDGLRDLLLCEAIVQVHLRREPVEHPTALPAAMTAATGGTT